MKMLTNSRIGGDTVEIKKLEIDFEADILKINGEDFREKSIIVTLPGSEGWAISKLFNADMFEGTPEELSVSYVKPNSKP